jgi:hypothetical protein
MINATSYKSNTFLNNWVDLLKRINTKVETLFIMTGAAERADGRNSTLQSF